jgi:hypothetical protein
VEGVEEAQIWSSVGSYEQSNNNSGPVETGKILDDVIIILYGGNEMRKEEMNKQNIKVKLSRD